MRTLTATVVLATLLVTGACGSDDEPQRSTDSSTTAGSSQEPDATSVPEDVCTLVTATELSTALGRTVTTKTGPTGDCEFTEEDPRGLSGNVGVVGSADVNGGYPGYLSGVSGSMTDVVKKEVTGLGDAATVYTGLSPMGSGENLMGGGVVDRGDVLLQVTLVQAQKIPAGELEAMAEAALRVLDSKV